MLGQDFTVEVEQMAEPIAFGLQVVQVFLSGGHMDAVGFLGCVKPDDGGQDCRAITGASF